MARRPDQTNWPTWWDWDLEMTPHVERRMEDRDFSEVELRDMLIRATRLREDVVEGRFVATSRLRERDWEIILEPVAGAGAHGRHHGVSGGEELMKGRYLEVTYRRGRALSAYLYLPRPDGVKSARTERRDHGVMVDFGPDGTALGLEITSPESTSSEDINRILQDLGVEVMEPGELSPIRAA